MNVDALLREKLHPAGSIDLDQKLLADAESCLGYKARTTGIKNAEADRKVEKVLAELGIEPFAIDAVREYKAAKAENKTLNMLIIAALSFVAIAVVSGIVAIFWQPAAWGLMFLIATLICGMAASDCKEFNWKLFPIHEYSSQIPEFALQTAIDIKKRLASDVSIFVDELTLEMRVDPFLVAKSNSGKLYYLEVWNEPGFKAKREA